MLMMLNEMESRSPSDQRAVRPTQWEILDSAVTEPSTAPRAENSPCLTRRSGGAGVVDALSGRSVQPNQSLRSVGTVTYSPVGATSLRTKAT